MISYSHMDTWGQWQCHKIYFQIAVQVARQLKISEHVLLHPYIYQEELYQMSSKM